MPKEIPKPALHWWTSYWLWFIWWRIVPWRGETNIVRPVRSVRCQACGQVGNLAPIWSGWTYWFRTLPSRSSELTSPCSWTRGFLCVWLMQWGWGWIFCHGGVSTNSLVSWNYACLPAWESGSCSWGEYCRYFLGGFAWGECCNFKYPS